MTSADAVIDRTPTGEDDRGQEIQDWLDLDGEREVVNPDHEPIESYVVLDDNPVVLNSHRERFVRIDPQHGLQDKDVAKAVQILGMAG